MLLWLCLPGLYLDYWVLQIKPEPVSLQCPPSHCAKYFYLTMKYRHGQLESRESKLKPRFSKFGYTNWDSGPPCSRYINLKKYVKPTGSRVQNSKNHDLLFQLWDNLWRRLEYHDCPGPGAFCNCNAAAWAKQSRIKIKKKSTWPRSATVEGYSSAGQRTANVV